MPTNYTPHVTGDDATAATFNGPLEELDTEIEDMKDGTAALSTPAISSFTNAAHDHEDAAGGGQIAAAAIDSTGASDGDVLTADGAGGSAWETPGLVPSGAILAYGGSSAPTGWLLCFGQAVSRTTYATLFTAISTSYGVGDGSTTFNVPDLRGRFGLGKDNMGGSSANRVTATQADNLGQGTGAETHTLTTTEMPSHTHGRKFYSAAAGATTGVQYGTIMSGTYDNISNTESAGSGGAHNNMSPYQTVNYIIKT